MGSNIPITAPFSLVFNALSSANTSDLNEYPTFRVSFLRSTFCRISDVAVASEICSPFEGEQILSENERKNTSLATNFKLDLKSLTNILLVRTRTRTVSPLAEDQHASCKTVAAGRCSRGGHSQSIPTIEALDRISLDALFNFSAVSMSSSASASAICQNSF